jgi:hypothetical protein
MIISLIIKTNSGNHIRDTREITGTSELVYVINAYLSSGAEIIAIEEIDGDVLDFYSHSLSDDDLDAMAAEVAS